MALRALMLNKYIKDKNLELERTKEELEKLKLREAEIEEAINEAETDDEKKTVEETVEEHSKKLLDLETKISTLEKEIKDLEAEKEETETKEPTSEVEKTDGERSFFNANFKTRGMGDKILKVNKYETREQMLNRLSTPEVRDFYENLRIAVVEKRGLENHNLIIPEEVMLAIQHRVGDYAVLTKEVNTINLKGTARLVMNSGSPTLFWTEMCSALQESTLGALNQIQIDGFKLGGYVFVCNALIEDSMIDFANYIEQEFAKAIAKFKDEAIMNGLGEAQKQPEGIRTLVTETSEITNILGILEAVGSLGYGADGEVLPYVPEKTIAVMNRNTYYSKVLPETYGKDANGKIVYGLGQTLPDGTPIRISETVPTGEVVVGDFKNGYLWADRKGTTFDTNDRLKWVEEQTGFKVTGRHDGKVVHKNFFKRVVFKTESATPEA
ncbi:phage major capsid protein [Miniphocaeibacter massiliensis]|uniref:phage major capsid protein n=1 Tax=Miniphocaeibacter massiliensis TaxID=2041841 RepID=UPI000C1B9324|nr:phage major capsid protein [Miniphocaeibacter massiliensis]